MYYIICSCPRSGSTLLSEALLGMGAGRPEEYFNPDSMRGTALAARENFMMPSSEAYIERIKQQYMVGGIFGIKTHYIHMARALKDTQRMTTLFPGAKYIAITRRNILRQAISATRASQTKAWTALIPQQKNPRFNYLGLLKHMILTAQEIELWEKFYMENGIQPLRILYEDLDHDYENTMRKVASYLGITGDIPPQPIKKQADVLTEAWVDRFIHLFRDSGRLSRIIRFVAKKR